MVHPKGAILWDFDGTLAFRPGLWSGCLLETLDEHEPGHAVERGQLIPYLQDVFPWHQHEVEHPELSDPGAWWQHVEDILAVAFEGNGFGADRAKELASLAHRRYVDPSSWQLFSDTLPVLARLRASGWRHVILSNHVPELPRIVEGLGLEKFVTRVITSAATGYEKPHPRAFARALESTGKGADVWMVGDNVIADVRGAESVGIPAVLARARADHVAHQSPDLWGVIPIVDRSPVIHHVQIAIPVGGEAVAREFYGTLLRLIEVEKPANLVGRGGVWLRTGNLEVHLGIDPDFRPARKAHVAFRVNGLEAYRLQLQRAGHAASPYPDRVDSTLTILSATESNYWSEGAAGHPLT